MHTGSGTQQRYIGQRLLRKEDLRLLRGRGRFVADFQLHGMLHLAVLRSPHASARILRLDAEKARALPGVVAVYTARDLEGKVKPFPPYFEEIPVELARRIQLRDRRPAAPVLASDRVCYVGQPVAAVVAEDRATAEDALELIQVEYEPLPAVVDVEEALKPDSVPVHPELGHNVLMEFAVEKGDPLGALARAPHRLRRKYRVQRLVSCPMETRGAVAQWEEHRRMLTVWTANQTPHLARDHLAERLGLPAEAVRVVVPDIGGGFGPKANLYHEEVLVAFAAMQLGRPVKWIEDRREHFVACYQGRGQVLEAEVGFDGEGRLLSLCVRYLVDQGAYAPKGFVPSYNTAAHMLGLYKVPHYRAECVLVSTHKTPMVPYRGAGRPEAVFCVERLMDEIARHLGLDPAEVRRRNLIRPEEMPYDQGIPYRDGKPVLYDSGNFPATLEAALRAVGYEEIRRRQEEWRCQGRYVGVGLACYIEGTGVGPFEGAVVRVDPHDGTIAVYTGAAPQGQGLETALSQVIADEWGVTPDRVRVINGDTAFVRWGVGTIASRSAVMAGTAAVIASRKAKEKALAIASALLEVAPEDLEFRDGRIVVRGAPSRSLTLAEVARKARPGPGSALPPGLEPTLEGEHYWVPETVTYAHAVHAAVVEVDVATGQVRLLDYAVAHDCGVVINPMIADGQVVGGVAQGIGNALYEDLVYGENGQPLNTSFMDYLVPTAMEIPEIKLEHLVSPSPRNPLGIKGLGEGGAIGPPAAIANAVSDALAPWGVEIRELPIHPHRLLEALGARPAPEAQPQITAI